MFRARNRWLIFVVLFLHAFALAAILGGAGALLPASWFIQSVVIVCFSAGISPVLMLASKRKSPRAALSLLQIVSLFVVAFPLGDDLTVHYALLSAVTVEFLVVLGPWWWIVFLIHAGFIVFACIFPARAWGRPLTPPRPFELAMLESVLVALALTLRRYLNFARDLDRQEEKIDSLERSIAEVYKLNADFFTYAADVKERSTFEERKRVSRDIHDIMGYTLVNLRVMLEVALDLVDESNAKLRSILREAADHTKEGLREARTALRALRSIDERGELWFNRIHKLVRTFSSATGVEAQVTFGNVSAVSCPRVNGAVYQFVQEGLTNSFKHGRASRVLVEFRIEGGSLLIRVIDNGAGSSQVVPGIGFTGMAERFEGMGGSFFYRNLVDGFEVVAAVPVESMEGGS
jgi:signal transduction histidine kinase